jgi:transposase
MRRAKPIELTEEERAILTKWVRGRTTPIRLVARARIVLLAAEGRQSKDISVELTIPEKTISKWRQRFVEERIAGIEQDAPGGPRRAPARGLFEAEILRKTTQETPPDATQWSVRSMAAALDVSKSTVQRVWRDNGLKPHQIKTFKVSNDPQFVSKLVDVVGLYLNPPEHALVLSCDEKSQIQALDRTQKSLPIYPGRLKTLTHDDKRHATTTLFAAIELAKGKIIAECMPRHRHQEWLKFLQKIDVETPADPDLHRIVDNHATHKHRRVQAWLTKHPRFHIHFTPTSSSWLNLIERWFREITQKQIRDGVFRSVPELIAAIKSFVDNHNANPRAYVWTKSAADILQKVARAKATLDT